MGSMCGNAPADDHRVLARARSPRASGVHEGEGGACGSPEPDAMHALGDVKALLHRALARALQERECVGFKNTNDDTDNNDDNNTA